MDFVKWCLDSGIGGWLLLLLAAGAALVVVFAVLTGLMWLAGEFSRGWRKGWEK